MNKKFVLAAIAAILCVVAGGVFWWWSSYGQYRNIEFVSGGRIFRRRRRYEKYYEALKRAYAREDEIWRRDTGGNSAVVY